MNEIKIPVISLEKTGKKLKELREQHGLKISQLQKILGFNFPTSIYKWEHGETIPNIDNLLILSVLYNMSINDIIQTEEGE